MATYKPYRKTASGKEEVKVPSSSVSGLATVAISGSYNDLTDKPSIPDTSKFVTTDGAQEITGNKTISASQTILDTNLIIRHDSAIDSSKNITIASFRQGADILQIENEQVYYDPQGNGFPLNFKGVDPGTDGQVLTSRGANDSPEWADIPKVEVVQATGTSTTSAMSQKATTDELANKANLAGGNSWTGNQQFNQGGYWFATDTNHPFVVELENGKALVTVNQNGVSFDSDGLGSMPFRFNGNAGTSGQVLTSQGPGKTPIWEDAPSGGGGGISDVKVAGTSVVSSGVANIPAADGANAGVVTPSEQTFYGSKTFVIEEQEGFAINNNAEGLDAFVISADQSGSTATFGCDVSVTGCFIGDLDNEFVGFDIRNPSSPQLNVTDGARIYLDNGFGTKGQVCMSMGSNTAPEWRNISVKVNGTTYTSDSSGLIDLGTIGGGTTTYAQIYNDIY